VNALLTAASEDFPTPAPGPVPSEAPAARRRPSLRKTGFLLVLLAGLLGFGLAPTTASAAAENDLLVGTWSLTVTVYAPTGPSVTDPIFIFHPDHTFNAYGPDGDTGNPIYAATGFWTEAKDGSFSMYVTHGGAEGGVIPGTVQAIHLGVVKNKHEHSSAYAFVHSPDGSEIGPITVTSTGHKTSDVSS
jgi:hypothetical protein